MHPSILKYNITAHLVRTIEQLYDKATSAVQLNASIEEWFKRSVGVRQGLIMSPTLLNIFLERIMIDVLEEHDGKLAKDGDQCRENQSDDKQCLWHPE